MIVALAYAHRENMVTIEREKQSLYVHTLELTLRRFRRFIFPYIQMRNVPQHISSHDNGVSECIWVLEER
jgi:hypothetical protein